MLHQYWLATSGRPLAVLRGSKLDSEVYGPLAADLLDRQCLLISATQLT